MMENLTVKLVDKALRQYERKRPDMGAANAIFDWLAEPASPFDPKSARPPKRWAVLFFLLVVLAVGVFIYFNKQT